MFPFPFKGVARMSMQMHAYTRPKLFFLSSVGILCLLLAGMLAGCNLSPGAQGHMFAGKLNLLQVPAPYSLPGQIVLGPGGNLWFPAVAYENFTTDKPSGAIGQLTPAGTFHLFPMPTPNTYPLDIAFGRDGKLWFSAFQGNGKLAPNVDQAPRFSGGHSALGQMSQDGNFHMFTLPSPTISPGSIAVGADGNLWFSIESYLPDYSTFGEMGRITPQGVVTIFTLGKFAEPRDMTVGPDNNIWFSGGGFIGRITMHGQVCLFTPDPQANAFNRIYTSGITTGSDGALWFATQNVAVGRVTTAGAFKFYPFPPNTYFDNGSSSLDMGNLRGIVAGGDGTLWLTNDGQIGHFV
jgi:virginiamycin B lyase